MSDAEPGSIFDAIGGRGSVSAAVDIFYQRVLADESLASFFQGTDIRRLKGHQAAFLAMALGGPKEYHGRAMAEAHRDLDIADEHFDRVAYHLAETLGSLGLTAELVDTIIGRIAPLRDQVVTRDAERTAA